jgi:hypothetical protein
VGHRTASDGESYRATAPGSQRYRQVRLRPRLPDVHTIRDACSRHRDANTSLRIYPFAFGEWWLAEDVWTSSVFFRQKAVNRSRKEILCQSTECNRSVALGRPLRLGLFRPERAYLQGVLMHPRFPRGCMRRGSWGFRPRIGAPLLAGRLAQRDFSLPRPERHRSKYECNSFLERRNAAATRARQDLLSQKIVEESYVVRESVI